MHHIVEHFGVSVSAISGVLAARGKQVDLFGVIVLALVSGLGGGTIRDLILQNGPVFWLNDQNFLINAFITAIITFFLVRYHEFRTTVLMVADAFSLAFFTIVGTQKGLAVPTPPGVAILMGVITGVGGGILRDLLLGEIPLVFRRQIYLYATAAFCGSALYVLVVRLGVEPATAMAAGIIVTLSLRLAGIWWKLALPIFQPKDTSPPPPKNA